MRDLSDLLNSCFDQRDDRAPIRAFVFGAVMASIPAAISSMVVDPHDLRMLAALLCGATLLGGGCGAMFALPPDRFRRWCSFGFHLVAFAPVKGILGIGILPAVLLGFSYFAGVLAAIAAVYVLYLALCSAVRWLHSTLSAQ